MKSLKMEANKNFILPHLLSGMPPSTPILLALSGGADSRALLHMLDGYCKENGATLSVAHVNHMIRGKDAENDRDFCEKLAKSYGLPFYLLEADVPALAKQNKRGLEEEARAVRYEFFSKIMRENKIPLLATAHNATDNAETVIFNLARGSGLKGLCGIPHTRSFEGGIMIRPIIKISKRDILEYCRENHLEFVTDQTNSDVVYSRNRIRNNVIPELESINENAIANISRMSELTRADDSLLDGLAREFIESSGNGESFPAKAFTSLPRALKTRVASMILGQRFEVSAAHVESLVRLAEKATPHSRANFPASVVAIVENGNICITTAEEEEILADYDIKIEIGETILEGLDMAVLTEDEKNSDNRHAKLKNIYKNSTTTLISSDRINNGLFIRTRREGDKILCGGVHKKLKKLLCEKKIPLKMRQKLPIFYDADGIVWIPLVATRDGEKKAENQTRITLFYN